MTTENLGADDLGALMRHTPDWVRAECRAGRLPYHRIGKRYVFTPEDVAEILSTTAVGIRSEPDRKIISGPRSRRATYRRTGRSEEAPS